MDTRDYVTTGETLQALRKVYQEDGETNLQKAFLDALSDELKPIDEGRWRPNTLIVLLAILLIALFGIFLYFSVGAKR